MKKLLLLLVLSVMLVVCLSLGVAAADDFTLGLDNIESSTATATTFGDPSQLLDGNKDAAGGWYNSVSSGWCGPNNAIATIVFDKEYDIVSGSFYAWTNNNSGVTVKLYDAQGNETASAIALAGISLTDGSAVSLDFSGVKAKSMTVQMGGSNKYEGNGFRIAEIVLTAKHIHEFNELIEDETYIAPTCGANGSATYKCACGETTTTLLPATEEHIWDEGAITVEPTETTEGVKTYTCTTCGQTKTEKLQAIGHNWDEGTVVAPTCTEDGYKIYRCTDEGCEMSYKVDPVDALGHSWDEGVTTVHPTLTKEGTILFSCTRDDCDEQYTSVLPSVTISDSSFVVGKDNIIYVEESINGTKGDKSNWENMFDGNNANASWSQSHPGGWYAPEGSTLTIVFEEEYYVIDVKYYVWSNWNSAKIEFFDASGNVVYTYLNNSIEVTSGTPLSIADCAEKAVKSMKITINEANGGTGQCLDFQEFVITAHKHMAEGETARYDEVDPSCLETGSYKKYCYICEKDVVVETPSLGGHDIISDLSFGRGYDSVGTLQDSCQRCDYTKKSYVQPIVSTYGYSVSETGVAGITHKVEINLESLKIYNACVTTPLEFGMVAAATPNFENAPLEIKDGAVQAVNSKIKSKSFANSGYASIEYSISNIQESFYETPIVLCAYVYDGKSLIYINANSNSGEEYETVTINDYRE